MTTLAFKDGVFATDTLCDSSDYKIEIRKLFWHKNNTIMGISGQANAAAVFVDWFCSNNPKRSTPDFSPWFCNDSEEGIFNVMVVQRIQKTPFKYKISYWNEHCHPILCLSEFSAEGSGAQSALAAMFCGMSSIEAIQITAKYDLHTGGFVEYADFKKPGKIFKCSI